MGEGSCTAAEQTKKKMTNSFVDYLAFILLHERGHADALPVLLGDQPFPCLAAYGASKAALNLITETLRHELEPWGVQVSTILPSSYRTGTSTKPWTPQLTTVYRGMSRDLRSNRVAGSLAAFSQLKTCMNDLCHAGIRTY